MRIVPSPPSAKHMSTSRLSSASSSSPSPGVSPCLIVSSGSSRISAPASRAISSSLVTANSVSPGRRCVSRVAVRTGFTAPPPRRRARARSGRPARLSAIQMNVSRLPFGPGSPELAYPSTVAPSSFVARPTAEERARGAGRRRARRRPRPTCSRPTSNCGLTSARQSYRSAAQPRTAGSTLVREMNETSITIRSGA